MSKVYIVIGETGEYSDHQDWEAGAYLEADRAEAVCAQLNQWCQDQGVFQTSILDPTVSEEQKGTWCANVHAFRFGGHKGVKPALDPQFKLDYTGTRYFVWAIDLKG